MRGTCVCQQESLMGLSPSFLPRQSSRVLQRDQKAVSLLSASVAFTVTIVEPQFDKEEENCFSRLLRVHWVMTAVTVATTRVICFSLLLLMSWVKLLTLDCTSCLFDLCLLMCHDWSEQAASPLHLLPTGASVVPCSKATTSTMSTPLYSFLKRKPNAEPSKRDFESMQEEQERGSLVEVTARLLRAHQNQSAQLDRLLVELQEQKRSREGQPAQTQASWQESEFHKSRTLFRCLFYSDTYFVWRRLKPPKESRSCFKSMVSPWLTLRLLTDISSVTDTLRLLAQEQRTSFKDAQEQSLSKVEHRIDSVERRMDTLGRNVTLVSQVHSFSFR